MENLKEYLINQNDQYTLVMADVCPSGGVEVPKWADYATKFENAVYFWSIKFTPADSFAYGKIVWQRHTQPEELPFVDDEPKLDEEATAESRLYGAADNVNNPSHYNTGAVECIDALESATVGKSGIEAVCVANVIKYLWRYKDKNGIEDVKKAQWYLGKLISVLEDGK